MDDSVGSEIPSGCILERPKVIHNPLTKKFVMWFHLEPRGGDYGGARSAVAIADTPAGPYQFLHSLRPNAGLWPENVPNDWKRHLTNKEHHELATLELGGAPFPWYPKDIVFRRDFKDGQMARDMTLFVDDDGTAYQFYASENNATMHVSQLTDDYLKPAGKYARIFIGRSTEAPAVFKRGGKYYLIGSGCTGWQPNAARVAVADNIFGPWKELGNPCQGADADKTYFCQSAYVLPVAGQTNQFIALFDRWSQWDLENSRYVWLPLEFSADGKPTLRWQDHWSLPAAKE